MILLGTDTPFTILDTKYFDLHALFINILIFFIEIQK